MHTPRTPTAVQDRPRGGRLSTLRAILTGERIVPPRLRPEGRQGPPRPAWRTLTTLRAGETTHHPRRSLEVPRSARCTARDDPSGAQDASGEPGERSPADSGGVVADVARRPVPTDDLDGSGRTLWVRGQVHRLEHAGAELASVWRRVRVGGVTSVEGCPTQFHATSESVERDGRPFPLGC